MVNPKFTTAEIIDKAERVHGVGTFDYSKAVYKGSKIPMTVICPKPGHGEFYPRPGNLINKKSGCPKCSYERIADRQRLGTDEFNRRSCAIHGEDAFDRSEVEYVDQKTHVILTCKVCNHRFLVQPTNHIDRKSGCPKCADRKIGLLRRASQDEIIARANEVHKFSYDYSKAKYTTIMDHVTIICPKPGHGEFRQTMQSHINQGCGCPICGQEQRAKSNTWDQAQFEDAANAVHEGKYDYSKAVYEHNSKKVTIICRACGAEFKQRPVDHIHQGQGCPSCARSGFDPTKPGTLYYLRIEHEGQLLYKIGITNQTVDKRFKISDLKKIDVISTTHFEQGENAFLREREILQLYKEFRYEGPEVLSSGNTEIFTVDVLMLDL